MECETDQWLNMKMYNSKMRLESHLEDRVVACFERDFMAAEVHYLMKTSRYLVQGLFERMLKARSTVKNVILEVV